MFSNIAEKVAFANYFALLTEATADDGEPTPGYLLGEIRSITFQSQSCCHQLLDYLIHRLSRSSTKVKIKVLKMVIFLIHNGHVSFRQHLRQCDGPVRAAVVHYGPLDSMVGNTLYKEVQNLAQETLDLMFSPEMIKQDEEDAKILPLLESPTMFMGGMGASARSDGKYEGFGNTSRDREGTVTDKMFDYFGRFIHSSEEQNNDVIRAALHSSPGDYQPVVITSSVINPVISPDSSLPKLSFDKSHTPGRAGGGWESDDDMEDHKNSSGIRSSLTLSESVPLCDWDQFKDQTEKSLEEDNMLQVKQHLMNFCGSPGLPTIEQLDQACLLCLPDELVQVVQVLTKFCSKYLRNAKEDCLMRTLLLFEWIHHSVCSSAEVLFQCEDRILNDIAINCSLSTALRSKARKLKLIFLKHGQVESGDSPDILN